MARHSRSDKHGRLDHVIGTREMSGGRSLGSVHFIRLQNSPFFALDNQASVKRTCVVWEE